MLRALSPFDIGQAAVVIDGHVVGVEDIEGTDGLLARVARLRQEGRIRAKAARGVLVKAPKSGQDLRFDLPTIGPQNHRGRGRSPACRHRDRRRQHHCGRTAGHDRGGGCRRPFRDRSARVMPARSSANVARKIFLIATEESGDRLGANLMKVLRQRLGDAVQFEGVGGQSMAREGLVSLFPIEELSIMGLAAVVKQLPMILRRIRQTADAVTQASPDILVIIDSPDFTHRVARRVRARDPSIPIDRLCIAFGLGVAARPGARDARLCRSCPGLAAVRAGGVSPAARPALQLCRSSPDRADRHAAARMRASKSAGTQPPPVLLVLPGSRRSEIRHHMAVFGETLGRLADEGAAFEPILPTMPHLQEAVATALKSWTVTPRIVVGEQEKRAAFRIAHAAFAKSGTATLELALAGVPMVAAYRAGAVEAWIMRSMIQLSSVILANLVSARMSCRNSSSRIARRKSWCRRCATSSAIRRCGGGRSRLLQRSIRSCRPATSRRAYGRPTSCWRRCEKRGGQAGTESLLTDADCCASDLASYLRLAIST